MNTIQEFIDEFYRLARHSHSGYYRDKDKYPHLTDQRTRIAWRIQATVAYDDMGRELEMIRDSMKD